MGLFHHQGSMESVQTFGRKKTAIAVAYCKRGRGIIKINGCPIELVEPETLRYKVYEPILLLGSARFSTVDIRIRVKGGGFTSQIYAIRWRSPSPLWHSTRSTWMRRRRRRSRTSSLPTTVPSSLPTPVAASRRSSVVVLPVLATRSRTVKSALATVGCGAMLVLVLVFQQQAETDSAGLGLQACS